MKPFPDAAMVPECHVVLDPPTQTGRWLTADGTSVSEWAKHRRSETSKETSTRTSLDGNSDQGSDQEGDTD
jgi:putative ATP-grasp target RiPP